MTADSRAPATLKYLSDTYLISWASSVHFIIFSMISLVSPYVLVGLGVTSSVINPTSASPYVAAEEEKTIGFTSNSVMTCRRTWVPYTLLSKYLSGFSIDSPTRELAAK